MFRIYVAESFWWPVKIAEPTDEGWKSQTLEVKYRNFTAEDFDAFMTEVRTQKLTDREVVARVVLDWRTVVDASGGAVPFTPEAMATLLRTVKGSAACLVRDFIACHTEAPEKN